MKRYDDTYGQLCESEEGDYVEFDEAQAEIDSRDKRIAELEAAVRLVSNNPECRRALSAPDWDQVRFSIGGKP